MECPHLRESVKVNRDFIKNKKCELSTNSTTNKTQTATATAATTKSNKSETSSTTSSSSATSSTSLTSNSNSNGSNKLWKCLGTNKSTFLVISIFLIVFMTRGVN